ncbi:MAG TPA: AAA family ATPase [Candidatus Obscuribacterales bacterium]
MSQNPVSVREVNESVERIRSFYNTLCGHFLNRNEVLRLMITATVAQEPLLFVGRPGTAKSLLVSVFCQGLRLPQSEYFEYMLTKFTEPSEVMGPVDIVALKEGRFIRKTAGLLPTARVAFLDEIFKANSAILNMLLTIINERKYFQEGTANPVPLVTLFAASNEIPDFAEFDALKDRFILKVETRPVIDSHFHELIRQGIKFEHLRYMGETPWQVADCSLEDFLRVRQYLLATVLPRLAEAPDDEQLGSKESTRNFRALIATLRHQLNIEITDRKLIKLYKLLITQAFLFNGGTVGPNELKLLCYCANHFREIRLVEEKISEYLEK